MASPRVLIAALVAAWADSACREPHPALPYYHAARESPKLAVLAMYYYDLPASHVPTADQFKAMLHGPAIEAAFERISDGCLTPETFSPDFFVVPNQGASHPADGFLCGKDGQPESFFETSELWDVGAFPRPRRGSARYRLPSQASTSPTTTACTSRPSAIA